MEITSSETQRNEQAFFGYSLLKKFEEDVDMWKKSNNCNSELIFFKHLSALPFNLPALDFGQPYTCIMLFLRGICRL